MPSRKVSWPGSIQRDRQPEPKFHRQFNDVFEDEPATDIPDGTLAKTINAWAVGNKARPRNGSALWTSTRPPAIEGRTGYAAHTEGQYIVSDSGNIFSQADVSYLWGWDDGYYDEIVEYISPTRVRRRDTVDTHDSTYCWLQGKLNLFAWHRTKRLWVIQLGTELWIVNYEQTQWTKVLIDCVYSIANAESTSREDGDNLIVANSRFIYRVILDSVPPMAYPINMPNIATNFTSNSSDGRKNCRYNYLISMSRLDGTGNFRHRLQDPPPKILTESGTTRIDENRKDWAEMTSVEPIDAGVDTYGQLDGGALGADVTMENWDDIGDGTFNININGQGYVEFVLDFKSCKTLYDVAQVVQDSLRNYFPVATCEYLNEDGNPHFRITSGRVAGGTVSFMYDGTGGTTIAAQMHLRDVDGAVQSNPRLGLPLVLRYARIPLSPWTTATLPQHWPTHYGIYRTADYGVDGAHLDELGERVVNSPETYIWNKDLRVCGSFIARRIHGVVQLRSDELGGEFERADQGCVVEFEDGSRVQINDTNGYIDNKNARYGGGGDIYYGDVTGWMAAEIGEARVCRVSQSGDVVTVYPGSDTTSFGPLAPNDIGKRIYWPNGYYSYIKRRISATQWQVYDSTTRIETACAIDPQYRAYCDVVKDDDLIPRASGLACRNRFMREVLASNTVCLLPGFVVFAARGSKEVRYCAANPYYKQFLGFHNREYQTIELQDKIMALWDFTSMFSAFCQSTIYSAQSNNSQEIIIAGTQARVWQIAAMEKRADVGLIDHGAVTAIGKDVVRFVSNLHEVIDFNGWDFVQEIVADQVTGLKRWWRSLRRSHPIFAALYSQVTGYLLWWVKDPRIP